MDPALSNALADGRIDPRNQYLACDQLVVAPEEHDPSEPSHCSKDTNCQSDLTKHQCGWRRIVRNFTPSWFSVCMGTGIVSILLHNLPYNGDWLHYISCIIFALNVFLFVLFLGISILRYTLYPRIWTAMVHHQAQSLFLGTFPMGLATIVNMLALVCVPAWGGNTWILVWVLWWIDAAISVAVCIGLPFILMFVHEAKLENITAAWLLPVVTCIVASASGSIVADVIPNARDAQITLLTSYALLGIGFPLAMIILVLYFLRLTIHSLPPREVVISTFLPLGPIGQGGFAIQQLGIVSMKLFKQTGAISTTSTYAGDIVYVLGLMLGLIAFGFGLVWLFFALATIRRARHFPFNMGWWAFVFPLGVYASCTATLGMEIPSAFFRVLGTIFSVAVTLLWVLVSIGTLKKAWTGEIFVAPCLKDIPEDKKSQSSQEEELKAA